MTDSRRLVDKLWSYCDVLRDDGVGVIEYTEQLTYLLFLKMAHERATRRLHAQQIVPEEYSWQKLLDAQGDQLEFEYTRILNGLGRQPGVIGTIFRKAQNRVQDPAKLKRLVVDLIDKENWSGTGTDIKGDAYEDLLSKGASDKGSGAGQYFTPRALIQAIVDVVQPTVDDSVVDPACGTGGFLLVAHEYAERGAESMTPTQRTKLQDDLVRGYELVDGTARLAAMNLLLHGMGTADGDSLIEVRDSLIADPGRRWSVVLSNPPFGKKSSLTMVGADGREAREEREIERQDFVATTSNKQLNFVQHIMTILDTNGRAAVVLPDNVLFEGGAGETIRRKLLTDFDLHTMLRLPTGIFYAQGVKANVLFFDKKVARPGQPWTERLWVYDLRTTSTSPSSRTRSGEPTWTTSSRHTSRVGAASARRASDGSRSAMTRSWSGTRPTSTSPGCATSPSRTSTTCPRPRFWPARSSRTSLPRCRSSRQWQRHWRSSSGSHGRPLFNGDEYRYVHKSVSHTRSQMDQT